MKRKFLIPVLPLLVFLIFPITVVLAETESLKPDLGELIGKPVQIETTGRGNFQGMLLSVLEDRVEIEGSDGEIIQISRSAIENYTEITPGKKGRAYYQDSASNRLLFAPTSFAMEPGEFHIADQELAVVTASYGLNKNISFWGGISPIGALFSGRFIATLSESFAMSAGTFIGLEWIGAGGGPVSGLMMPYGLFSAGKSNNNFTAGGAAVFLFNSSTGFETIAAVAVLGGKIVLTSTTALVTENWIIWGKGYFPEFLESRWKPWPILICPALAFRIAGSRFSWDIGAVMPLSTVDEDGTAKLGGVFGDAWIPLPWLSVTYRIR